MVTFQTGISSIKDEEFPVVMDLKTCLPVEPIQRYINFCRQRGLANNTVIIYARRLVDYFKWLELKFLDWRDIGLTELADFTNWYLLGGEIEVISEQVREAVSKRSPKTVNLTITAIQNMYEFHAIEGRIDEKQFTKLSYKWGKRGGFLKGIVKSSPGKQKRIKLKEPKVFPGCLTDEEVMTLADTCTTWRDRFIFLLMRSTGIRRGELLGLRWCDLSDLDRRSVIRIIRREDNPNHATAKRGEREIPLVHYRDITLEAFEKYCFEEYPSKAEELGHGMVFVNLKPGKYLGKPMSSSRVNDIFKYLEKQTGIEVYPHLNRHTLATRMLQENHMDETVQHVLGHKSVATTKDTYSHVLDEMTLEDFLLGEEDSRPTEANASKPGSNRPTQASKLNSEVADLGMREEE